MRLSLFPPPSREHLGSLRLHEVVRDYPELLPTLRGLGIDLGERGGEPLGDLLPSGGPELDRLFEELRWRVDPVLRSAGAPDRMSEGKSGG